MNQFLRMVLHSKYISFYSTVCSSITRSCSMNINYTASVEAVRLSIEWVDNMAKSKHNILEQVGDGAPIKSRAGRTESFLQKMGKKITRGWMEDFLLGKRVLKAIYFSFF